MCKSWHLVARSIPVLTRKNVHTHDSLLLLLLLLLLWLDFFDGPDGRQSCCTAALAAATAAAARADWCVRDVGLDG